MATTPAQFENQNFRAALVIRAQAGDRTAFDLLARQVRALLFALAFMRTSHREEAEDLVQEILTRAWQKLPTLADPLLFVPWLRTITANACTSWFRHAPPCLQSLEDEATHCLIAEQTTPLKILLAQDADRYRPPARVDARGMGPGHRAGPSARNAIFP